MPSTFPYATHRARRGVTRAGLLLMGAIGLLVVAVGAYRIHRWRQEGDTGEMRSDIRLFAPRANAWFDRHGAFADSLSEVEGVTFHQYVRPLLYEKNADSWLLVLHQERSAQLCSTLSTPATRDHEVISCMPDNTLPLSITPSSPGADQPVTLDAHAALRSLVQDALHDSAGGGPPVVIVAWRVGSAAWDIGTPETHTERTYRFPRTKTRYSVQLLLVRADGSALRGETTVRTTSGFYTPEAAALAAATPGDTLPKLMGVPQSADSTGADTTTAPPDSAATPGVVPAAPPPPPTSPPSQPQSPPVP